MPWSKAVTAAAASGVFPKKGQTVFVHCTGIVEASGKSRWFAFPTETSHHCHPFELTPPTRPTEFWSTKDPGQKVFNFKIGLGQVIPAWDEGVLTMQVGVRVAPHGPHTQPAIARAFR